MVYCESRCPSSAVQTRRRHTWPRCRCVEGTRWGWAETRIRPNRQTPTRRIACTRGCSATPACPPAPPAPRRPCTDTGELVCTRRARHCSKGDGRTHGGHRPRAHQNMGSCNESGSTAMYGAHADASPRERSCSRWMATASHGLSGSRYEPSAPALADSKFISSSLGTVANTSLGLASLRRCGQKLR